MYTTQRQVRQAFWQAVRDGQFASGLSITPRKITNYSGNGKMYNTDTRCAFVDFLDSMSKDGQLADSLKEKVTL